MNIHKKCYFLLQTLKNRQNKLEHFRCNDKNYAYMKQPSLARGEAKMLYASSALAVHYKPIS
jgi:hypothetical protein